MFSGLFLLKTMLYINSTLVICPNCELIAVTLLIPSDHPKYTLSVEADWQKLVYISS